MPFGILALIDLALIIHVARTGRSWVWVSAILFLPGLGSLAYFVLEVLPEWTGSYRGQRAQRAVVRTLNPTGRYKQLTDELAIVDTIANRAALAEECLTLGKFDEALTHAQAVVTRPTGDEPGFEFLKARAQFGVGDAAGAVATLEDLKKRWPAYNSAEAHLLYGVALEALGRTEEALATYDAVGAYYPGAEPRVRQAQLLARAGRPDEAKALAAQVVVGLKRAPRYVRAKQREWMEAAKKLAG
jgi:hypothetical protein